MIHELVPYIDANFKPCPTGIHGELPEFSSEDMELSASVCGIQMSLALCMQCIR